MGRLQSLGPHGRMAPCQSASAKCPILYQKHSHTVERTINILGHIPALHSHKIYGDLLDGGGLLENAKFYYIFHSIFVDSSGILISTCQPCECFSVKSSHWLIPEPPRTDVRGE